METLRIGRPPQLSTRSRVRRAALEIGSLILLRGAYASLLVALLVVATLFSR